MHRLGGEPFHDIAHRVVRERLKAKNLSVKQLADELHVNYRSFLYRITPERKLPADILPGLCRVLEDYTLLDVLEEQVNRVAFTMPVIDEPNCAQDLKVVQKLVKEVGDALQVLAETLEDHIVEDWELQKTLPALDDVIRECVRLKAWLCERHRRDETARRSAVC